MPTWPESWANRLIPTRNVLLDGTGNTDREMDQDLLDKVIDIQKLAGADREHILFAIEAMLRDAKARKAYAS